MVCINLIRKVSEVRGPFFIFLGEEGANEAETNIAPVKSI